MSTQRKMQIRSFIKYLRNNKGFVVIGGEVYRVGYKGIETRKTLYPYHVEDIGYKYSHYRCGEKISPEILSRILTALDIHALPAQDYSRMYSLYCEWKDKNGS